MTFIHSGLSHGIDRSLALQSPASERSGTIGMAQETHRAFEATLLQVLIEPALPKGQSCFGRGAGAELARSQMSLFLAESIATTGTLGIARILDNAGTPIGWRNGGMAGA